MKRLCLAVGAKQIVKLDPPTAEDMGHCDSVEQRIIGASKVLVFAQVR